MTEEHSLCYFLAKELRGMTTQEFWREWENLNSMSPDYSSIHKNCDCNEEA
jgi:hypothetical protein